MSVTGTNLASATGATTLTSLQDGDLFYAERSGAPGRITYADIRTDLAGREFPLGGVTPASAAVTSLAATSASVTAAEFPAIDMVATTSNSGWRIVRLVRGVNNFAISVLTQAGVFVSNAYEITIGAAGATAHIFRVNNSERLRIEDAGLTVGASIAPNATAWNIGGNLNRFGTIFLVNSPNVSSDARLKEGIADLTDAERRAAAKIKPRTFTMNGKRKVGYIAQEIIEAMQSEGLCAFEYGLVSDGETYGVDYDAVTAFRSA